MYKYIKLEKLYEYEHTSRYDVSSEKRALLLKEVDEDEFELSPHEGRIILNDFEEILKEKKCRSLSFYRKEIEAISGQVPPSLIEVMFEDLQGFISVSPVMPDPDKEYHKVPVLPISVDDPREKITDLIQSMSINSEMARLALYVYRQMDMIDWLPFIKAAIERNPVCHDQLDNKPIEEIYQILTDLPDFSIYDNNRLAQPDEVWNFRRGDGAEKALLLANYIIRYDPAATVTIDMAMSDVTLRCNHKEFNFKSNKKFRKKLLIAANEYRIEP